MCQTTRESPPRRRCHTAIRSEPYRLRRGSESFFIAALVLFFAGGRSVYAAQLSTLDVAASYALTEGLSDQNDYRVGWLASAAWSTFDHWGITGEIGGGYRTLPAFDARRLHLSEHTFMGGVRFGASAGRTVRPFGQLLLGAARFSNDYGSVSYFCWQPGGGIDINATGRMAIRFGVDYRLLPTDFHTLRQVRFATGIVFENAPPSRQGNDLR